MSFELKGILIAKSEVIEGEGANGPWKRQKGIVSYMDGDYEKKAVMEFWGDKVDKLQGIPVNSEVEVKFNLEGRQSKKDNEWFGSCSAWYLKNLSQTQGGDPAPQAAKPSGAPISISNDSDDLPF